MFSEFKAGKRNLYISQNVKLFLLKFDLFSFIKSLTVAVSPVGGRILQRLHLKADCVQAVGRGCPIAEAPPNAAFHP